MSPIRMAIRSDLFLRGPRVVLFEIATAAACFAILGMLGLLYTNGALLIRFEACLALASALNWSLAVPIAVQEAHDHHLHGRNGTIAPMSWKVRGAALVWLLLPGALVIVHARERGATLTSWPPRTDGDGLS